MSDKDRHWMTITISYEGSIADMKKMPNPSQMMQQIQDDFEEINTDGVKVTVQLDDYYYGE